ncbi:uncharacterized protein B0H18DRAFT_191183 [Fomitopsis serialis]|uniref:uncharacterized protein n=1 Tax=Fomitopsis serialis TaxID=139415 RepID=UPI0020076935|nr:uncharacterized protein B0H18DRAFT_191183 [Neoantrodia serialis]KAH9937228.1 hypothetical protein B0H18DRAFT_191183 [Neoantrodia serialis]
MALSATATDRMQAYKRGSSPEGPSLSCPPYTTRTQAHLKRFPFPNHHDIQQHSPSCPDNVPSLPSYNLGD